MKKSVPKIGEREGNENSLPIFQERESEAFLLGNGREREFPLTHDSPAGIQAKKLLAGQE